MSTRTTTTSGLAKIGLIACAIVAATAASGIAPGLVSHISGVADVTSGLLAIGFALTMTAIGFRTVVALIRAARPAR